MEAPVAQKVLIIHRYFTSAFTGMYLNKVTASALAECSCKSLVTTLQYFLVQLMGATVFEWEKRRT